MSLNKIKDTPGREELKVTNSLNLIIAVEDSLGLENPPRSNKAHKSSSPIPDIEAAGPGNVHAPRFPLVSPPRRDRNKGSDEYEAKVVRGGQTRHIGREKHQEQPTGHRKNDRSVQ